jgi:TRAP-type mannitol/chloroaromatic compound transport system substrate-binding protein
VTALKSDAIDASEWVGRWMDMAMGLAKAGRLLLLSRLSRTRHRNNTWHQQIGVWVCALGPPADRGRGCRRADSLAEFNAENVKAPKLLRADPRIKILRFNDELIKTFGKLSKEVLADTAAKDTPTRKVYDSYMTSLAGVMDWGELSETGDRDTRRLALG